MKTKLTQEYEAYLNAKSVFVESYKQACIRALEDNRLTGIVSCKGTGEKGRFRIMPSLSSVMDTPYYFNFTAYDSITNTIVNNKSFIPMQPEYDIRADNESLSAYIRDKVVPLFDVISEGV